MADPLSGWAPNHQTQQTVDDVGQNRSQGEEADIDLGIPKDPPKQEDRPAHMPEQHGSVESAIRQHVGDRVVLTRYVLQLVGDLVEQFSSHSMELNQPSIPHPPASFQLAD